VQCTPLIPCQVRNSSREEEEEAEEEEEEEEENMSAMITSDTRTAAVRASLNPYT